MNFQVETDIRIFTEKIQEVFGSFVVIIERTVEYTHVFDTMLMNIIQTFANGFQWDGTDRLFAVLIIVSIVSLWANLLCLKLEVVREYL